MSQIVFKPATREASYARIALTGPSGSGKTYTSLAIATVLGDRVAVVDTERGSASKYVGLNGWQFDTVQPDSFSPRSLVDTLAAATAGGYDAIVIDSLSHYWMGVDGMLEQADRHSVRGNTFAGWKEVRPDERRMIDALVSFPGHVVVTMRSKTEYVIEENEKGKKAPRKVGMKPEQREGIEYEFDVVGDLDYDNTLTVSKTRIHTLSRARIPLPGEDFANQIAEWLSEGERVPTAADYRKRAFEMTSVEDLKALYEEVSTHRLVSAPTTDDQGNTGLLGDLIKNLATRAKRQQSAADPEQQETPNGQ